ncbi:MAG: hypothetical protein SFY92_04475 [Verrucomicrobiae bacterium]|nr:hypothetical protein [Verrucomicrobiae bacterium]
MNPAPDTPGFGDTDGVFRRRVLPDDSRPLSPPPDSAARRTPGVSRARQDQNLHHHFALTTAGPTDARPLRRGGSGKTKPFPLRPHRTGRRNSVRPTVEPGPLSPHAGTTITTGLRTGSVGLASAGTQRIVGAGLGAQHLLVAPGGMLALSNADVLLGGVSLGTGVLFDAVLMGSGALNQRRFRERAARSGLSIGAVTAAKAVLVSPLASAGLTTGVGTLAGQMGLGALLTASTLATMGVSLVVFSALGTYFYFSDRQRSHWYHEQELDLRLQHALAHLSEDSNGWTSPAPKNLATGPVPI